MGKIMKTTKVTAALISCLVVALPAMAETKFSLKKDSTRGMKDGELTTISASELPAVFEAQKSGAFYVIDHNNVIYKLRVSDVMVVSGGEEKRTCLPGEKQIIAENASIGGTQMGSGEYDCK